MSAASTPPGGWCLIAPTPCDSSPRSTGRKTCASRPPPTPTARSECPFGSCRPENTSSTSAATKTPPSPSPPSSSTPSRPNWNASGLTGATRTCTPPPPTAAIAPWPWPSEPEKSAWTSSPSPTTTTTPPSCEAIQAAAAIGLNLLILAGEEVTVREIGGHILSLNASGWVGKARHGPDNDRERAAICRDEIGDRTLAAPLTAEQYSHAVWTVRHIRRLGGLAILAHPFWEGTTRKYYPPRALVDQLLRDDLCDGIELLGGSPSTEGNRLAVARYCDEAQRGRRLPVVGCSDAHGQEDSLGRYWTVAFAADLTAAGIAQAVTDCHCVACEALPGRDAAIYGPSALVEYAYFLHREFFPLHDRLCFLQAQLHRRALLPPGASPAPPDYAPAIADLQAELNNLYQAFRHPPAP